jgi:ribonuclease PH
MNLVMNDKGGIIEIQGTSEKAPFSASGLEKLFSTGSAAIRKLIKIQKDSVR